jgi:outer membrane lipoprotein-sorting protein
MKKVFFILVSLLVFSGTYSVMAQQLSATDIIRKADEKFNGEKSSLMVMAMTIIRPTWQRTIECKNWTMGREYALTLVTAPAKDVGQTFLKRANEMWSWNPSIGRLIKLPPSMMSQGWMGSDYTNDDILKESSLVNDYTHQITGEESIDGRQCYRINMVAKDNAAVVWGHQIRWVDKKEFLVLKAEYYDVDGALVRTETGSDIKNMDGRMIQTKIVLTPVDEPGKSTVLEIKDMKFNIPIDNGFFSQQNMKSIR